MARGSLEQLVATLWREAEATDHSQLGDADLLDRYVAGGDERAFRALVGRHGALVWTACSRALRSHQDAEDAFQATFVALAKQVKAGARIAVVPAWLRAVAWRAARDIRTSASHRREVTVESLAAEPSREPTTPRELAAVLNEEVAKLPDELRRPFELCRFQDRTYAEAANVLGCSVATVCRRVEQAASALRERLTRRGWVPSGSPAAAVFVGTTALAIVPPGLAARAAEVALAAGSGKAIAPALGATADAVLRPARFGMLHAVGSALLLAACGVGGYALFAAGPAEPAAAPAPHRVERAAVTGKLPERAVARVDAGGTVAGAAFSADGSVFATVTVGPNAALKVWRTATGEVVDAVPLPQGYSPLGLAPLGDGFAAIANDVNGSQRWVLWRASQDVVIPKPLKPATLATAFSPDGRLAAVGTPDRLLILDPWTGEERARFDDVPELMDNLRFAPDGRSVQAHSRTIKGTFAVWAASGAKWKRLAPEETTGFQTGNVLATSPDCRFAAVPCDGRFGDPILIHDLTRRGAVAGSVEVGGGPFELVFSRDARMLAATNRQGTIRVWEATTGKLRREFTGHTGKVFTVAFSADGRRLVSGGDDGTAVVWDLGPAKPRARSADELLAALKGTDATAAFDAVLDLAERPADAAKLLEPVLLPPKPNDTVIAGLIADLSSADAPARTAAEVTLERAGRGAEAAMRAALAAAPADGPRIAMSRLTSVLDDPRSPRRLLEARGMEALERAGSTDAHRILAAFAVAYPDSLAGRDAETAARRLRPPQK